MANNVSVSTVGSDDDDNKKQTLKMQKKEYRHEKKRVAKELITALKDPTVVVMADWLKIRGTLRKWTRFYCVLKPGILLVYKSPKTQKHGYWVGTVLLNTCELIERPSKKDGFCFKLFHPLDQSIWATRGPRGESLGAVTFQPLPTTHLICRAASVEAGQCWMDALELSLRCSGLLMRTMHKLHDASGLSPTSGESRFGQSDSKHDSFNEASMTPMKDGGDVWSGEDINVDMDVLRKLTSGAVIDSISKPNVSRNDLTETEAEKHFDAVSGLDEEDCGTESDTAVMPEEQTTKESPYVESAPEQFGSLGAAEQTEEVAEENKSLVWLLMKQVRPGMDLSKVVLPTFILEPRSFLEKLADYYYHSDLLTEAVQEQDPYKRMISIVRFYLSGFYKKPKGLKKPYNPILGEQFRCYFAHPDGTRTYYVAEQVSHHPPISALFISNRQAGFNVSGTIFAKSKFYGNSLSAMMNGNAKITLLGRGESYTVTLPYAYCKGLIVGTLSMELGGQVTITCDRTSYTCELDFKLKPFLGGTMNGIAGKVKLGKETLAEIDGYWDGEINLTERATGRKTLLWKPTPDVIKRRLKRFEIPFEQLEDFESRKLWHKVTEAINAEDQQVATDEKTVLEQAQRERAKHLKAVNDVHRPKAFELDPATDFYMYKHADFRPWDPHNDLRQVECDYVIRSVAKHRTPLIRSNSVGSVYQAADEDEADAVSDESSDTAARKKRKRRTRLSPQPVNISKAVLEEALKPLQNALERAEQQMARLQQRMDVAGNGGQMKKASTPFHGLFEQLGVAIVFAAVQAILLAYLLRR